MRKLHRMAKDEGARRIHTIKQPRRPSVARTSREGYRDNRKHCGLGKVRIQYGSSGSGRGLAPRVTSVRRSVTAASSRAWAAAAPARTPRGPCGSTSARARGSR